MKLEGDLSDTDLLPLLIDLARQKFTGAVRFERDAIIKIIYFREGDVLSASTSDQTEAMDEILVRGGKISRDHVRQAVSRRKNDETIADALLALGFITRKELAWARRVQLVGIVRSVGEWKTGSYSIVHDHQPKREEGTIFHVPQIVVEAIVTDTDRGRIETATEGGNAVYERAPGFDEQYAHLGLNEEADAVVQRIDGSKTAAELSGFSGEDSFTVFKLLRALELLELIRRKEKSQVTSEILEPQVKSEVPLAPEVPGGPEQQPLPVVSYIAADSGARTKTLVLLGAAVLSAIAGVALVLYQRKRPELPVPRTESRAAQAEPEVRNPEPAKAPAEPTKASPEPATRNQQLPIARDPLRERYDAMARSFSQRHAATRFSLQIELVCQTTSVKRAIEIGGEKIWFIPIRFRGQDCYRVFWGSYATRAAAEQAMVEVPRVFREGSKPTVIEMKQVL